MIVPMHHLTILCTESSKSETLHILRSLAVLHITQEVAPSLSSSASLSSADASLANAQKALNILLATKPPASHSSFDSISVSPEEILNTSSLLSETEESIRSLSRELERYAPFGNFNPAVVASLASSGIYISLFTAPASSGHTSSPNCVIKVLSKIPSEKRIAGLFIGTPPDINGMELIPLPSEPLASLSKKLSSLRTSCAKLSANLSVFTSAIPSVKKEIANRQAIRNFHAAAASMGSNTGIAWITGFCPSESLPKVSEVAHAHGWAISSREPLPDELPPTLLRPPRIFRPIQALFDILGIAPSYYEVDVSVIFYAFFTIFFAMLIGDAGYGLLLLLLTLLTRAKFRKAPSAPFILLSVFSSATISWGILSCTYFGFSPSTLRLPTASWLGNNSNIMQLCFILGACHLTIARLWSAVKLFPSSKTLAEIGWIGVVWTMYCAACMVVVEGFVFPSFMLPVFIVSFFLILFFMLKKSELKTDGINLAILPLNVMSCLGDIISYVRLFAVGIASVKVAENFNSMALSLDLPLALKIPIVLAILLIGHGLNFAMGALSILVHAVRLNTLEFSNHKGITWSGFAYEPFRNR